MLVIFSKIRALSGVASVSVLIWLVGCSGNTIHTYDGDKLPDEQVAILKAKGDIDVVAIDGKPMKKYLVSDLDIDYHLLPGSHTVILRYSGVWAAPKKRDKDSASSAVLIESDLLRVDFTAVQGATYVFDYVQPENRRQAKALSENFVVHLRQASGGRVASGKPYKLAAGQKVAPATADPVRSLVSGVTSVVTGTKAATPAYPVPASAPPVQRTDVAPVSAAAAALAAPTAIPSAASAASSILPKDLSAGLPRLDALKLMWQQASKEEKKAFLRWAFQ